MTESERNAHEYMERFGRMSPEERKRDLADAFFFLQHLMQERGIVTAVEQEVALLPEIASSEGAKLANIVEYALNHDPALLEGGAG